MSASPAARRSATRSADGAARAELCILDETDSGLDIDALRIVADGVNALRSPDRAMVVITHYQRLLELHRAGLRARAVVKSGGKELALELDRLRPVRRRGGSISRERCTGKTETGLERQLSRRATGCRAPARSPTSISPAARDPAAMFTRSLLRSARPRATLVESYIAADGAKAYQVHDSLIFRSATIRGSTMSSLIEDGREAFNISSPW
jgi:energy-coupling factor transporter ATP-binding protein EcfA2